MASPITKLQMKERTEEDIQNEALQALQAKLAEEQQAVEKLIAFARELNHAGILDAMEAFLQSREKITEIAVNQVSRQPVTNLINHFMEILGTLTTIDPNTTAKLMKSIESGLTEAELYRGNDRQLSIFDLLKALKDPAINEALQFGFNFLKGMGKELQRRE